MTTTVVIRSYGVTREVKGRTVQSAVRAALGRNVDPRPFDQLSAAEQDLIQRWRSNSWAEGTSPWGVAVNTLTEAYDGLPGVPAGPVDKHHRGIIVAVRES